MNYFFDTHLKSLYKKETQQIRAMSENWVYHHMYCPNCGNDFLMRSVNNSPVMDFQCKKCDETYELKSTNDEFDKKILGGAYSKMIQQIRTNMRPNLLLLQYDETYKVNKMIIVPKFFIIPDIIEKRSPLSQNARRPGWVGCYILYNNIPNQGKLPIISDGKMIDRANVIADYQKLQKLRIKSLSARGWLIDTLRCINMIDSESDAFTLKEIYNYSDILKKKYPNNNNIEAKIRQQLQFLRDRGFVEFIDNQGLYKKLF